MAALNAGQELFDVVKVTDPRIGVSARKFRVIGIGLEYSRHPSRRPRYDSLLALGEMD